MVPGNVILTLFGGRGSGMRVMPRMVVLPRLSAHKKRAYRDAHDEHSLRSAEVRAERSNVCACLTYSVCNELMSPRLEFLSLL